MNRVIAQTKALTAGVLTAVFALSIVALGVLSWTDSNAGVVNTKHNLGTSNNVVEPGTTPNQFTDGGVGGSTASVCVFCHTPHGGSTAGVEVPLWQKDPSAGTYTTYANINSATIDGSIEPVGSVSIACLSCHDGTQAMNSLLNEPGSGASNAAFQTGSWVGDDVVNGAGTSPTAGFLTGAANLTQDISNDHPIGIQYGGGGVTGAGPVYALGDPDFNQPATAVTGQGRIWWVDTADAANTANRDKTDMILYNRDVGGIQPYVECATCHDPHSENTLFLRTSNDSSALCLACHTK